MTRLGTNHPHWWREMRTSRGIFRGMGESDQNFQVQYHAFWQVVSFRLAATQHEASGWWYAPPWFSWLHSQDFMPVTDASGPKNLQVMKQGKTLTLAQALQACVKESKAPTCVLCNTAWDLQRCMTPLITLSGDDIAEAYLLRPAEEKHGTSNTPEE